MLASDVSGSLPCIKKRKRKKKKRKEEKRVLLLGGDDAVIVTSSHCLSNISPFDFAKFPQARRVSQLRTPICNVSVEFRGKLLPLVITVTVACPVRNIAPGDRIAILQAAVYVSNPTLGAAHPHLMAAKLSPDLQLFSNLVPCTVLDGRVTRDALTDFSNHVRIRQVSHAQEVVRFAGERIGRVSDRLRTNSGSVDLDIVLRWQIAPHVSICGQKNGIVGLGRVLRQVVQLVGELQLQGCIATFGRSDDIIRELLENGRPQPFNVLNGPAVGSLRNIVVVGTNVFVPEGSQGWSWGGTVPDRRQCLVKLIQVDLDQIVCIPQVGLDDS